MDWGKLVTVIRASQVVEQSIFPLFFHSQDGNRISGAIMIGEEVLAEALPLIVAALHLPADDAAPAAVPTPPAIALVPQAAPGQAAAQ